MTLVVNLYGSPGTGKSTTCAGVFYHLKRAGVNCEMAREFAKDKVWEESYKVLSDQIYVFGKQNHKLHRLNGKVDVIITDSPLPNSIFYDSSRSECFKDLVLETHFKYDNMNIFLSRVKEYNPAGRLQTEEEANEMTKDMANMLWDSGIICECIDADDAAARTIASKVYEEIKG